MKKLMVLAAAAVAVFAVEASSFNWRISSKESMYAVNGESSDTYFTGTGYLFDNASVSQSALLAAVVGGSSLSSLSYLQVNDIDDGDAGASTAFTWGSAGDTLNAYMAAVMTVDGNDYLFISDIASANATASTTETITIKPEDDSAGAPAAYGAAFSGAGWYQTTKGSSVPEPTSGLLMLLGVAGLALRRRRA